MRLLWDFQNLSASLSLFRGAWENALRTIMRTDLGRPVDSSMVTVMVFGTPTYTVV
jgi:hypothetical protein